MQDLLWQLKDTDAFTVYMALAFTAAVFWFIREIVDAPMLAVVSVPFLIAGGIVSPGYQRCRDGRHRGRYGARCDRRIQMAVDLVA
jgi:hypothetical protein